MVFPALLLSAPLLGPVPALPALQDWPCWRGEGGRAIADGRPPIEWGEDENVRWKVAVPGKGLSSPIVSKGVIYLTTAVPTGKASADEAAQGESERPRFGDGPGRGEGRPQGGERPEGGRGFGGDRGDQGGGRGFGGRGGQDGGRGGSGGGFGGRMSRTAPSEQEFKVLALDLDSGATRWESSAVTLTPHEGTHGDGSFATPTLATDGTRLYVSFGSFGIFCYDLAGKELWRADLGDMSVRGSFGEGTSPVLAGGNVVILWSHEGESFLVALDAASGKEAWRQPRKSGTAWVTPAVIDGESGPLVLIGGSESQAYDARTGELIWYLGGDGRPTDEPEGGDPRSRMSGGAIATPVVVGERIYMSTGGRRGGLIALAAHHDKLGAIQDAIWTHEGDAPSVPSPIVVDDILFTLRGNSGILAAIDTESGESWYADQRLTGVADVYASPVAANGHLYFCGRDGTFEVVKVGTEFESVAVNTLEDRFDASPAIVGDWLLLRGHEHLYCIAAEEGE